jgi:hypothetical protein
MASAQFVFPARVDEDAMIVVDDPARFAGVSKALKGKPIELVIRKPKSKRSLDMNAYLHSETGPFRLLAEYFGDTIEGVKYDLMGECFGWVKGPVSGKLIPIKAHSSDMTVEESRYFVDWVVPFGAQHGVIIPFPDEWMATAA